MSKGSVRRPGDPAAFESGYDAIDWRPTLHTPFGSFKLGEPGLPVITRWPPYVVDIAE